MPCLANKKVLFQTNILNTKSSRIFLLIFLLVSNVACAISCFWYYLKRKDQEYENDVVPPKVIFGFGVLCVLNLIIASATLILNSKSHEFAVEYKISRRISIVISSFVTVLYVSFGALCLLLVGKDIYDIKEKERLSGIKSVRIEISITAMAFIYISILVQVFMEAIFCEFPKKSLEDPYLSETPEKINVDLAGNSGDIVRDIELHNKSECLKTLTPNLNTEISTITPQPDTQDRATSPPSFEKAPAILSELREKKFAKQLMSRNRMVSEDPVSTFVSGRTFPAPLEITADELDTARKKLKRNSVDYDKSSMPKILPIVFEDNDEIENKDNCRGSKSSEVNKKDAYAKSQDSDILMANKSSSEKEILDNHSNGVQSLKSNSESAPIISMKKDSTLYHSTCEVDEPDDVFMPNVNEHKEIVNVEVHSEPLNNQLLTSHQTLDESDASKTSSTEEELLDKFYNKLEMLKRCGHKPIDLRMVSLRNNNNDANHSNARNSDNFDKICANNMENQAGQAISAPLISDDSPTSIVTKFSSLKLEDTVEARIFDKSSNDP